MLTGTRYDVAAFGELVGDPSRAAMLLSLLDGQARPASELAALAGAHVAETLEVIVRGHGARLPSRPDPARLALARARTCCQHLAGQLGVAWLAALEREGLLRRRDGVIELSPAGGGRLGALGLSVRRWPTGKPCLDWTERRNHLGGALGGLLTERLLALKWVARREDGRAVRITSRGREGFASFGVPAALLG